MPIATLGGVTEEWLIVYQRQAFRTAMLTTNYLFYNDLIPLTYG
jgi:hypothetical protein